jgi:hypothetical protein
MRESEWANLPIICGMGIAFKMGNCVWDNGAGLYQVFRRVLNAE